MLGDLNLIFEVQKVDVDVPDDIGFEDSYFYDDDLGSMAHYSSKFSLPVEVSLHVKNRHLDNQGLDLQLKSEITTYSFDTTYETNSKGSVRPIVTLNDENFRNEFIENLWTRYVVQITLSGREKSSAEIASILGLDNTHHNQAKKYLIEEAVDYICNSKACKKEIFKQSKKAVVEIEIENYFD